MIHQTIFVNLKQSLDKKWIKVLMGWCIPLIILIVTYFKLSDQIGRYTLAEFNNIDYLLIAFVLFLLPVNISLEAFKWKVLCEPFEKKTMIQYLKIVLAGRSADMITPFGIGDASTRILTTRNEEMGKSISSLIVARITQFVPTILFGTISVYFLIGRGVELFNVSLPSLMLSFLICIFTVSILIFLNREYLKKILSYVMHLNWELVFMALFLSFLRYLVFSFQFYLAFRSLGVLLDAKYLWVGIFWIFFVKSVLPNISIIGDLVKRELSSILYFSLFDVDLGQIAIANLVIWLINIVIPVLLGSVFLSKLLKHKYDLS